MRQRQIVFVAIVVAAILVVAVVLGIRRFSPGTEVVLNVLYSTEKEHWLTESVADFEATNPTLTGGYRIKINLQKSGSNEMVANVLNGTAKPDLISPASTLQISMLEDDSARKFGRPLVHLADAQTCQSVFSSPLVFVGWQERMNVLWPKGIGPDAWQTLQAAAANPKGWSAFGKPEWGYVKFSHTDPRASNSGLMTLVLMSYGYFNKSSGLTQSDVLNNPQYQTWFAGMEQAISQFGNSTGDYMREIVTYGPSKYDLVAVYEAVAIEYAEQAKNRYGALQVYYPPVTLMSDHPFCIVDGDWVSTTRREAAAAFMQYLLSKPAQERALKFGYRPVNVEVAITGPTSSFVRYQTNGLRTDLPPQAERPPSDVLNTLLDLWQRSTRK